MASKQQKLSGVPGEDESGMHLSTVVTDQLSQHFDQTLGLEFVFGAGKEDSHTPSNAPTRRTTVRKKVTSASNKSWTVASACEATPPTAMCLTATSHPFLPQSTTGDMTSHAATTTHHKQVPEHRSPPKPAPAGQPCDTSLVDAPPGTTLEDLMEHSCPAATITSLLCITDVCKLRAVSKRTQAAVDEYNVTARLSKHYIHEPLLATVASMKGLRVLVLDQCKWLASIVRDPITGELLKVDGTGELLTVEHHLTSELAALELPMLRMLCLHSNNLKWYSLPKLARTHWWMALEHMSLGGNAVSNTAIESFSQCPNLRELLLCGCGIGVEGVQLLAKHPLRKLQVLDLRRNPRIGPQGVVALSAGVFPALQRCHLDGCNVGDTGANALAAARWPAFKYLSLASFEVSRECVQALAAREVMVTFYFGGYRA